jgi:hypothetical protein
MNAPDRYVRFLCLFLFLFMVHRATFEWCGMSSGEGDEAHTLMQASNNQQKGPVPLVDCGCKCSVNGLLLGSHHGALAVAGLAAGNQFRPISSPSGRAFPDGLFNIPHGLFNIPQPKAFIQPARHTCLTCGGHRHDVYSATNDLSTLDVATNLPGTFISPAPSLPGFPQNRILLASAKTASPDLPFVAVSLAVCDDDYQELQTRG